MLVFGPNLVEVNENSINVLFLSKNFAVLNLLEEEILKTYLIPFD